MASSHIVSGRQGYIYRRPHIYVHIELKQGVLKMITVTISNTEHERLIQKKIHHRESFNDVIGRVLDENDRLRL